MEKNVNRIISLKSEILGKQTQIDNLCKAILDFDVEIHKSEVEFDPDGRLNKTYMNLLDMMTVGGNTIEH
tara:strand:- start:255 stop:464 length:210 start_codon:yes stop_codon:yes gene_type:complete